MESLKAQLKEAEASVASLQTEVRATQGTQCSSFSDQNVVQLASARGDCATVTEQLEAAAADRKAEVDTFETTLAELRRQLAAVKSEDGSNAEPEASSVENEALTQLRAEIAAASEVETTLTAEVAKLREDLAERSREEEKLRAEIDELRAESTERPSEEPSAANGDELAVLKEEVAALKAAADNKASGHADEQSEAVQVAVDTALQAASSEHKAELDAMLRSVETAQLRVAELQEEHNTKDSRVRELSDTITGLQNDLTSARTEAANQLADLGREIETLKNEKDRVANDGEQASDAIKELATECTTLRTEVFSKL